MDEESLQELKETLAEMRDSNGTMTEQETAKFLLSFIDVLLSQKK